MKVPSLRRTLSKTKPQAEEEKEEEEEDEKGEDGEEDEDEDDEVSRAKDEVENAEKALVAAQESEKKFGLGGINRPVVVATSM